MRKNSPLFTATKSGYCTAFVFYNQTAPKSKEIKIIEKHLFCRYRGKEKASGVGESSIAACKKKKASSLGYFEIKEKLHGSCRQRRLLPSSGLEGKEMMKKTKGERRIRKKGY